MPNTPTTPDTSTATTSSTASNVASSQGADCDYEFSDDNLLALWLEFQKEQVASCPVTGAKIDMSLENDPAEGEGEPVVRVECSKCGRTADFKPGPHEGFGWAE